MSNARLDLAPEVAEALAEGAPVVALESTLIAHGLPEPRRLEVAAGLELAVRAEGAVPATIAVLGGRLRVGLDRAGLERLAGGGIEKASLHDLPIAMAERRDFATTVAATMAIAARAGIRFFATGGIGGVHRGVLDTYDESADLTALARYPVLVVSAGAKAVLDLPRTLERLETLGVPVIGFRTRELPAFYCARSGLALKHSVERAEQAAEIAIARFEELQDGGILLVQAPPADRAQDPERVEELIRAALADAEARRIRGSALTPFLLRALDAASGGSVVDTNVALVLENAQLAARVARAYAQLLPRPT